MAAGEELKNVVAAKHVRDYIAENYLNQSDDKWTDLLDLANLTALRHDAKNGFFISNFWRGPMLYSLVRRLKPKFILELGTGRGYGAFCMVKALVDGGIEGKLITVDRTPADTAYEWPYKDSDGKSRIVNSSLNEFWQRHLPQELTDRIEFRCGDTALVHNLLADQHDEADLVFIDGDHSYVGVALDFLSAQSISAPNAVYVFDDYSSRPGYGILRLLDEELTKAYSLDVIDMDLTAEHDIFVDHMMAICNDGAVSVETDFTSPTDMKFRYLLTRRWVRSRLIGLVRLLRLR